MFQFRRFPSYAYFIQHMMNEYCSFGLLHSDICGSMFACNSPQLFAAYHVLLRLLMPRHSPCALISLTILNYALIAFKSSHKEFLLLSAYCSKNTRLLLSFIFLICIYLFLYSIFKLLSFQCFCIELVGTSGLEPPTSRLSGVRSNRLSYAPAKIACDFSGKFTSARLVRRFASQNR